MDDSSFTKVSFVIAMDDSELAMESFRLAIDEALPAVDDFGIARDDVTFVLEGSEPTMDNPTSSNTAFSQPPTLPYILTELRAALPDLQHRYGVASLGIFGSYVRGEETPASDVDLLVEFDDRPLTLLQFIALENELSDLLQVPVDLVEKDTLKPTIGKQVLKEVRLL